MYGLNDDGAGHANQLVNTNAPVRPLFDQPFNNDQIGDGPNGVGYGGWWFHVSRRSLEAGGKKGSEALLGGRRGSGSEEGFILLP
jgi:hypothetical protein